MSAARSPHPQAAPTFVDLALLGSKIVSAALFRLLTVPFRWYRWNGAAVIYKDVFFAAIRAMLSSITIAESRHLYKTTSETYEELCKRTGQVPRTIMVKENDVVAHWIGKEDAGVVILFLHGGGFTQPCTLEHMTYFHRLVTDINDSSNGSSQISVLLLAYTLAPEAEFPTQLKQSVTLLSHLLKEHHRSARDIMITGDSAGGGLALSLLSHLLHPHLEIQKLALEVPLRGVFLYSPWVSFSTDHASFIRNAFKDTLVPNMLRKWAGMYLGITLGEKDPGAITAGNNYSEALLANYSWWEGMHKITSNVWIWAGKDEVFFDPLVEFGTKFEEGWNTGCADENKGETGGKVTLKWGENDAHIGPIMDVMLQYKEKSESQLALEEWLKARL